MNALAQINVTEKFFNAGLPTQSNWWMTLCGSVARCDAGPGIFISTLLPNILVLAGIIFFFMIVAGGWGYLLGAGGEPSAQDKAKAKAALTWGVAGFLLVVSAYFILQIIWVVTGVNFLKPNI
ncbi:MAG: hypothetical protein UX80_C0019G0010 [Candidatus Amesbacteria bacterium GW2011_GWA2_47_11b]|uniref:Uncharacterized protein n=3 Tax=Candidatus Amesiibacteriota TaxID=1752730 RepID=A0A0G1TT35_9BACT|nr:MAG: hypothetical protein UX42_C0003G0078 [Microgenomates group bacterium GW2011_GWC1_46_20]KKU57318.1 MAG: hypothetical protein UX80_C0019G0010 [Candidatus Amesbacteria bacterium GW2011_GWA2_47_11b]KKU83428.1 MAG: hypothetical protein UY11_C0020G0010 [Candidatus Amesbacteria bacterium GW2011_GWC2_47_8]